MGEKLTIFEDINFSDFVSWKRMLDINTNIPEGQATMNCAALWASKLEEIILDKKDITQELVESSFIDAKDETLNKWAENGHNNLEIDLGGCVAILQKVWLNKNEPSLVVFYLKELKDNFKPH